MPSPLEYMFGVGALLGRSVSSGRIIRLKDPKLSTLLVGAHGTGKSTVIMNLILTDIDNADKGVVVLDPHGDLAKAVALRCPPSQVERVVYFAPAEQLENVLGLNPFELKEEKAYELKFGALMDVFAHTWYGDFSRTPTLQNTLETIVRTLLAANPKFQTSILHMLQVTRMDDTGRAWRRKLAPFVKDNPALAQNWTEWKDDRRLKEDIQSSRQKIKHIIASDILASILCQPQSAECFQFQDVLSRNGVLLVNLEGLEDEGQRLIGSIILTQLLVMARLRDQAEDRVPCHIYADEFYKFSPQSFVTIINEARKYRLFCTLAHQNLEQLDGRARAAAANCGNIIVFRVNPEDSNLLGKHFLADGQALPGIGLSNLPRYHALVRYADGKQRRQALIQTFRAKGEERPSVAAAIRARSLMYAKSAAEIRRYVNDILETKHDESPKRGQPPVRSKPKTANNQTG